MKSSLLSILFLCSFLYAQYSGNLIHLNVNQDTVNYSDTLGVWKKEVTEYSSYSSQYIDIVRTPDSLYFFKRYLYDHEYFLGYYGVDIVNPESGYRETISSFSAMDVLGLYYLPFNIYEIEQGFWIFDDVFGNGFLSKSDSIYVTDFAQEYLYHISGKVDSLYFVIWNDNFDLKFMLVSLAESPRVDTSSGIRLNFEYGDKPVQIEHFADNLYFIQTKDSLKLYAFQGDSFHYIKTVLPNVFYTNIYFNQNHLYAYDEYKLTKHTLNLVDTTFSEGQVILKGDIYVDRNYKYAVKIDGDSLYLFDIPSETILKSWDISRCKRCFKPLIDYPDIYFHNTTVITGITRNEPIPRNALLVTAYPNPFNSSIVFQFENHVATNVEIKIFDIHGKLVKQFDPNELVNTSKVIWRPDALSSGVYFVRIKKGSQTQVIKTFYIK